MKTTLLVLFFIACTFAQNSTVGDDQSYETNCDECDSPSGRTVAVKSAWNWPYPNNNNFHRDILGVQVYVSNVNIGGSGQNTAIVNPGAASSISFNWNSHRTDAEYCPGCIVQYYWGFSYVTNPQNPVSGSNTPVRACYSMGNWYSHTSDRSGSYNIPFTAPTVPGMHFFTWSATLDYYCRDVGFSQCQDQAFAAICVSGDTDGDGVDDCFDVCPCKSGSSCPVFASVPADEVIGCQDQPTGEPTLRNDYCGASRASTGFLDIVHETSTATSTCGTGFDRTFTTTDLCTGTSYSATQHITTISSCDPAATAPSSDATATLTIADQWGSDGSANPQYRGVVTVNFPSAVNDWRVAVTLPSAGDHVVAYGQWHSVYSGAQFVCETISPIAAFTVSPPGSWAASVPAGGSVTFEYVATNNAGVANLAGLTSLKVYRTASS